MDKPDRGTDFLVYSNARHKKVFLQHFLMLSFDALIFQAILCDSCWLETIRKLRALCISLPLSYLKAAR